MSKSGASHQVRDPWAAKSPLENRPSEKRLILELVALIYRLLAILGFCGIIANQS